MGHHSSKPAALADDEYQAAAASPVKLPEQFTQWYLKSLTKIVCYMGRYQDKHSNEPLYCCQLPEGWYGKLVVHGGPDVNYPPIASAAITNAMMTKVAVEFFGALAESPGGSPSELIRYDVRRWKSEVYWFGLQLGSGADARVERFEWRRSHGDAVKSLGAMKSGWKLVRVGVRDAEAEPEEEPEPPAGHDEGSIGRTSDGKEIVAIWADHKGLTRIGEFRFVNSGATGELGPRFTAMALVSNLLIWQRTMQTTITTSAVAAS